MAEDLAAGLETETDLLEARGLNLAAGEDATGKPVQAHAAGGGGPHAAAAAARAGAPAAPAAGMPLVADTGAGGVQAGSSDAGGGALTTAALRDLRSEKRRLQAFLRGFEKSFEEREGRKVKYVKDISDVLSEYTRYKHVKTLLSQLKD